MGRAGGERGSGRRERSGGAERKRGRRERSGRQRRGAGEIVGQPDDVGRKKRAPNSWAPERPWLYNHDDL